MLKPGDYVKDLLAAAPGSAAKARGWIKTRRDSKGVHFLQLNDGSCFKDLQVVVDAAVAGEGALGHASTGASVEIEGELVASPAKGQAIELRASKVTVLGPAEPTTY